MLRICFAAAAAAAPTSAWFMRYLEKHKSNTWYATIKNYETGGEGLAGKDNVLKFGKGGFADKNFEPFLQSPVYWRRGHGFSVDRTLIRVDDSAGLLPISAARVYMLEGCKVFKESVPKADFYGAIPEPNPLECANQKYRFGAGFLPPWKLPATLRFERRFFGDGEILHVTCGQKEYAIATKGAVASTWEHDGCPFSATAKLFPSLVAKHFYVPVFYQSVADPLVKVMAKMISVAVAHPKKPTLCDFSALTKEVNNCRSLAGRDDYKKDDLVFMSGRKRSGRDAEVRLVEKDGGKPKGRVYLVLHPPKDATVDGKGSSVDVTHDGATAFFVKKRGGLEKPKSQEGPEVTHGAA